MAGGGGEGAQACMARGRGRGGQAIVWPGEGGEVARQARSHGGGGARGAQPPLEKFEPPPL